MGHLKSLGLVMLAQFILWLLLNIGVPIFGPMLSLVAMTPIVGDEASRMLIRHSIRDGQLFWVSIGLCASGLYEVGTVEHAIAWPTTLRVFFLVVFCCFGIGSILVITGATIASHFKAGLETTLADAGGFVVLPEFRARLIATAEIKSPARLRSWSVKAITVSAIACIATHGVSVAWPIW
jgi:hypothetical protein